MDKLTKTAPHIGLKLNTAKTKLMRINYKTENPITINSINNSDALEDVQDFAYLEAKSQQMETLQKMPWLELIRKASQTFAMLKPIWKSKQLRLETKLRLHNSNVLGVRLYGPECWKLTANGSRTVDGKRRRGRPKETWRRTVQMKECGRIWNTITKWAADRQQWHSLVDTCAHERIGRAAPAHEANC